MSSNGPISVPPHPVTLVCPVCGLERNLPENWQEMMGTDNLVCTADGTVMKAVSKRTWTERPEELEASRMLHIPINRTPLAPPPRSHSHAVQFRLTLSGTDTPPDWDDDQERILRKEMRLTFPHAEIERLGNDGEPIEAHVALFKGSSFHDCLTELGPVLKNFVDMAPYSPAVMDGRDHEANDIVDLAMVLWDRIEKRARH